MIDLKVLNKLILLTVGTGLLLAGCTTSSEKSSAPAKPSSSTTVAQKGLTKQMELSPEIKQHLSTYAERVRSAPALPLKDVAVQGPNVLYISPGAKYAIEQFAPVWNKLKPTPTVVWVETDQKNALEVWKWLGYKSDPLPSPHTIYTVAQVHQPDAYHKAPAGWQEAAGVLQDSESNRWIDFFNQS